MFFTVFLTVCLSVSMSYGYWLCCVVFLLVLVLFLSVLQSIRELQKRVFIEKESAASLSQDIDQLVFSEEYQGSENKIVFITRYKVRLHHIIGFHLSFYHAIKTQQKARNALSLGVFMA